MATTKRVNTQTETTDVQILGGSWARGTVNLDPATGEPASGGGGGGGAVTVADGADVALGHIADVAAPWNGSDGTATVLMVLAALWGKLNTLAGAISSGNMKAILQAGSALIGKVGIDQTTPGVTNAVAPLSVFATTPAAPSAAIVSGSGSNTQYQLVGVTAAGDTIPSASSTVISGAATPNNTVTWVAQSGILYWKVLRVVGGATQGWIGGQLPAGQLSLTDNGLVASAYTGASNNPLIGQIVATGVQDSRVSGANSTTTPLNAGVTFTGAWATAVGFEALTALVIADQAGTLFVDQSPDGTNVDLTDSLTIAAGVAQSQAVRLVAAYYRVRFTNTAGSNQTYLRLQTIKHPIRSTLPRTLSAAGNLKTAVAEALAAGENHVGQIGATSLKPTATFTRPADTTAYAANDAVCNSTSAPTPMSFTSAARVAAGSGVIINATLIDEANQTTPGSFILYLFSSSPTGTNDNAALAISNTDLGNLIGVIQFGGSVTSNAGSGASGNRVYTAGSVNLAFKLASGTTVFGLLQASAAYTPVSGEVFIVNLNILSD